MPWLQSRDPPASQPASQPGTSLDPSGWDGKRGPLTCMTREFPADLDIALTGFEAVDGTHVVQPPTCHKVP